MKTNLLFKILGAILVLMLVGALISGIKSGVKHLTEEIEKSSTLSQSSLDLDSIDFDYGNEK